MDLQSPTEPQAAPAIVTLYPYAPRCIAFGIRPSDRLLLGKGSTLLRQNRYSAALPSPFGTNTLLKQGARVVTDATDILMDFQIASTLRDSPGSADRPVPPMTDIERRVFDGLRTSPCPIDRLTVSLNLPAGECARVLLGLELKGMVTRTAGGAVARSY